LLATLKTAISPIIEQGITNFGLLYGHIFSACTVQ